MSRLELRRLVWSTQAPAERDAGAGLYAARAQTLARPGLGAKFSDHELR